MRVLYRVSIRGRILESNDMRRLLARAVREKRNMDRAFRFRAAVPEKRLSSVPSKADQVAAWVITTAKGSPIII